MKIRFLGTGAAEGCPAMFCNCEYCKNIRALGKDEYRTRSQVLIDGCISVDFPPEAFSNALKYGIELGRLKYIFATHSHMDHFYAHDFVLRGYKYARVEEPVLHIYGNAEVDAVFNECTAREMKKEVAPNLAVHILKPYQEVKTDEYRILTIPAQHSSIEDALLYYVQDGKGKGYLHLYDTGRIEDKAFEFLAERNAKAQVVAIDCTFTEYTAGAHSRHMGIVDDMAMKQKLLECGVIDGDTKIVITHFSHNGNPTRAHLAELEKKYSVIAAYDGFEIEV